MAKLTEKEQIALGKKQEALALQLAAKEDASISAAIVEQMEAKEITESGAIRILLALKKAYGQEMAAFPKPGTTFETSDNPDKFKKEVPAAKGGHRMAERSFYVEFADQTKEGKAILQELGWIKILRNPEANQNLVGNEFQEKYPNPEALAVRESYLEGRRNTIRNAYKKAVAFGYQYSDIEALDKVTISFVWADRQQTAVQNTKTPIRLGDADNPNKWQYVSISQLMRMSVPKAIEVDGGSYTSLFNTMKRDKDENGAGSSKAAPQQIRTADTFAARITDIDEGLDFAFTTENGKAMLKDIKDNLHKAGSDDLILSLNSIRQRCDVFLRDPKIAVRLQALLDAQDKAA